MMFATLAPRKGRPTMEITCKMTEIFQSMFPRRERHWSITLIVWLSLFQSSYREVTKKPSSFALPVPWFQSTSPWGWRLPRIISDSALIPTHAPYWRRHMIKQLPECHGCFNPHSTQGRHQYKIQADSLLPFQSTLLPREQPADIDTSSETSGISIRISTQEAAKLILIFPVLLVVSTHRP